MDIQIRLANYFRAAFPCIAIQTTEEARAQKDVIAAARSRKLKIVTWSAVQGMHELILETDGEDKPSVKEIEGTQDPIDAFAQRREKTVYIFRDPHTFPWASHPVLPRAFRELLQWAPTAGSSIVVIAPEFQPHPTVEKMVTVIDYTLPCSNDLRKICEGMAKSAKKDLPITEELLSALGGLSTAEAENALALSLIETKGFDAKIVHREKIQAVRRTGLLEIIDADPAGLDAVGGLENLKAWINRRRRAYSKEARDFGLPLPKGVLFVGVPGTGKSLSAKAIGTALGVPTLKWDIGSAFNSLVGASESRTRDTLALAAAIAPCVLWIDEIDKGLAGAMGSGSGDSGVTRRVLGTVLSFMQERKRPVFVVATANQVENLPPELLRKGRFDEIFAVNLPREDEREQIIRIHLARRKRVLDHANIRLVAAATEGFTGSELENVIEEAMFSAFDEKRDIMAADLIRAAKATTPLSVTAKEQVQGIVKWAETRARFASAPSRPEITSDLRQVDYS